MLDRPREESLYFAIEVLRDAGDRRWRELIDPPMRDDGRGLPGRDALQISLGDRVHKGILDAGIPAEDLDLKRFLSELGLRENMIPVPGCH